MVLLSSDDPLANAESALEQTTSAPTDAPRADVQGGRRSSFQAGRYQRATAGKDDSSPSSGSPKAANKHKDDEAEAPAHAMMGDAAAASLDAAARVVQRCWRNRKNRMMWPSMDKLR